MDGNRLSVLGNARDDILGGIPTMTIAGLFPAIRFQVKNYNSDSRSVCAKLNT